MNYEAKINALVPKAEKIANSEVKEEDYADNKEYSAAWNKVYHDTIDSMAAEAGLRGSRKYRKAA